MPDNKFTDTDIAKALKCCADKKRCHDCPFCVTSIEPCYITLAREAASLLSRRDAEIERLTSTQDILKMRLDNCLHFAEENVEFEKENRDLLLRLKQCETEIESLKIELEVTRDNLGYARVEQQKAESEIERLKGMVSQNEGVLPEYEKLIIVEAIKEFAERMKAEATLQHGGVTVVYGSCIDNLVKEMTEETP